MNRRNFLKGALMFAAFALLTTLHAASSSNPLLPIPVAMGRVAVVYFSWSPNGNTRFAAETIARKADAKVFEIKPEKPYSSDYRACCAEAKPECYGKQLRPIRQVEGLDLSQFDVIFIGTPNWFGTMAPPVRTFLTENASALQGKALCLFQTNGGGGMQRCAQEFIELLPGHKILPAKDFTGSLIRNSVSDLEQFVADRVTIRAVAYAPVVPPHAPAQR